MIAKSNEASARAFLRKQSGGRLGIVLDNGHPYVVPVNYLYRNKAIYIHSLPGLKISAMRANPNVCLQTDEVAAGGFEWQSVIAFGKFEEITDRKKKSGILRDFYKKFPHFTPVEAMFSEGDVTRDTVIFRINIERLTGMTEKY